KEGDSILVAATTNPKTALPCKAALQRRVAYEDSLLERAKVLEKDTPFWIKQLLYAADQFIVDRPLKEFPDGTTIIAGYHWFTDWGRDTMISLAGLTLVTGREEIARAILQTFAKYVDQGMLPNQFPDGGSAPEYNTVDATLWYFV